ncbi:MAG: hypothetical protein C5B54_04535 [Acidobacteria bacterium]|nr:MAG: hypothetical protein C5B54_04535 [Acidobacteriota bacterium]
MKTISLYPLLILIVLTGCYSRRDVITAIPTRTFREISGQRTYVHPTVTPNPSLIEYKTIAVKKLDNLMLDEIPVAKYKELNDEILKNLSRKKLFSQVLPIQDEVELDHSTENRVLILEGSVDDYSAGSRALRAAELGLNHAVITIRIDLKDASTQEVLGAATITVYERGVIKSGKSAVHKAAETAVDFVHKGLNNAQKAHPSA